MAISKKSFMGVAREATPGTAATAPTLYVPTKSTTKAKKKVEYLDEERGDRNANYDSVDTIRWGEWDMKGNFYHDSMLYFLIAAMGGDTASQPDAGGAPTAWKHTVGLADIPPALTLFKNYDAALYYHPYSVVEKFSFKFTSDGKLLEFDCSGKSLWPTKYTGSTLTPSFSTVKPFAGYAPTITLTSGATTDIDEFEVSFEQKITLWNPANGQPDWVTAYYGERKASLSFTARFDADALYNTYYMGGTDDTCTIDFVGALIGGSVHQELNIQLPVVHYDEMDHDLGKDNVLIKAKGTVKATGAGAGNNLIKLFAVNTVTSYAS
jgi:hypothetical protein